jgi:hypothetical protein
MLSEHDDTIPVRLGISGVLGVLLVNLAFSRTPRVAEMERRDLISSHFCFAGPRCALSRGDACDAERAIDADPLNGTRIDSKPRRDLANALGPSRLVQHDIWQDHEANVLELPMTLGRK